MAQNQDKFNKNQTHEIDADKQRQMREAAQKRKKTHRRPRQENGGFDAKAKREQQELRRRHQNKVNGTPIQAPKADRPTTKVEHRPTQVRTISNTIDPTLLGRAKEDNVKHVVATKLLEAVIKMIENSTTPWTAEEGKLAGELVDNLVYGTSMTGKLDNRKYRAIRTRFATTCYFQRRNLDGITLPGMNAKCYEDDLANAERRFSPAKTKQLVTN